MPLQPPAARLDVTAAAPAAGGMMWVYWTGGEVAHALGMKLDDLKAMVERGTGPPHAAMASGRLMFRDDLLRGWVASLPVPDLGSAEPALLHCIADCH
jgi:hypothetical protein